MELQLDHPKEKGCKGVPGFSLCKPPPVSPSCARAVLGCSQAPLSQGWLSGMPVLPFGELMALVDSPHISLLPLLSCLTCPQTQMLWSRDIIIWLVTPG